MGTIGGNSSNFLWFQAYNNNIVFFNKNKNRNHKTKDKDHRSVKIEVKKKDERKAKKE